MPTDDVDVTQYVDPFIGTGGHGHTYPGATVPFGMIQLSPDSGNNGWDWVSGYHTTDTIISGFSHLHLSGTGIGDLADVLFMPVQHTVDYATQKYVDKPAYASAFNKTTEKATPGYYEVVLKDENIKAQLTASLRTGHHRYTFPSAVKKSILIDLGFAINWDTPTDTKLIIEDAYTVSGYRFSTGWAKNQKVFFTATFSQPISSSMMYKTGEAVASKQVTGAQTAVQLFFENDTEQVVEAKVAVSSVSIANAKQNLDAFTFDEAKKEARNAWQKELSSIVVETETDSLKTMFYTALYHAKVAPVTYSDSNGEFRLENDSIAKVDNTAYSTLSLWDTFRAQQPLLTITNPDEVNNIIQSMLTYYDVHHRLPVWTLSANETNTMTGFHSVPVIAEAYAKGIRSFDVEKAFEAIETTLMSDDRDLNVYKQYQYIPYDLGNESVTKTLEYAYDDWCAAQLARALNKTEAYAYFSERAHSYKNLYDTTTGFMRGKSSAGNWHEPFDPKYSRHREGTDYTEGNAWQHSWFVLHDADEFIAMHGGADNFTTQLEKLFTETSEITGEDASPDISGLIGQYAHGNEPSHHIAYLFNKAGKPERTQYWVKQILKTQYSIKPNGLSGNEDCGQMSAWYVWSAMGLYPYNPASATYEIGTPIFDKTTLKLPNGKEFIIAAEHVSAQNFYIQSATLNGKPFTGTTLTHEQLLAGGTLHFVMGASPKNNK